MPEPDEMQRLMRCHRTAHKSMFRPTWTRTTGPRAADLPGAYPMLNDYCSGPASE